MVDTQSLVVSLHMAVDKYTKLTRNSLYSLGLSDNGPMVVVTDSIGCVALNFPWERVPAASKSGDGDHVLTLTIQHYGKVDVP